MNPIQMRTQEKSTKWGFVIAALFMFLLGGGAIALFIWNNYPNSNHVDPDFNGFDKPIFYQGELLEWPAIGEKESLKLPLDLVKERIDSTIVYEAASDSVIMTTKDKVVRLKTSLLTGTVNFKPFALRFPAEKHQEVLYIPIDPLLQVYPIRVDESSDTGAITLTKQGEVIQWGTAIISKKGKMLPLRQQPSIKSPIVADVKPEEKLMIWKEQEGWLYVQLANGIVGYMKEQDVVMDQAETVHIANTVQPFVPWKPVGGKINLTWEQVEKKNPDTSKIGEMPGLNVVSPTWFHLADGEGNLRNNADPAYVKWAQSRNYQVWALFSNSFDPKKTTEALSSYDTRMKMISQLLSFAQLYKLQGINIDFENVNLTDKAKVTQFIREFTPLAHEQGLVVSIDVTTKSMNEMWSMFYDRQALGEIVDYMMVMTYDEHWASSPKAGSVASLPWVEKGITQIMNEDKVPAFKLILGVPYYTRIWTERTEDGKTKVTSKAVSMETIKKLIEEKKLTPTYSEETGQQFVQYQDEENTIKIWIEDETSMKARAHLVKKYDFAGIASWKRGFERPEIWNTIQETLESRP